MMRHVFLLLCVFAFCYYNDSCNFKTQQTAHNVLRINPGSTVMHQLNGNNTSGYLWTAVIDNPQIISAEPVTISETLTQMNPGHFNFKIKGKHKGRTKIHFQYINPEQNNIAPQQIQIIEIVVS